MTMLVDRLFDELVQHWQFLTVINSLVFVVCLFCTYTVTVIFLITLICCRNYFYYGAELTLHCCGENVILFKLNVHKN